MGGLAFRSPPTTTNNNNSSYTTAIVLQEQTICQLTIGERECEF